MAIAAFVFVTVLPGQTAVPERMVATVTALKPESAELQVKTDAGAAYSIRLNAGTLLQRIEPGQKDLKAAQTIEAAAIHAGDRALIVVEAGTSDARRVVIMPASDIAKHDEADRLDWTRRGLAGVVASRKGDQVTLRMRSFAGESQAVVTITPKTSFRRYAPDSIKFADARPSGIDEISVGDQLRARGQKGEDGHAVTADDVVFGTFLTKAGTIDSINAETGEIVIKDLATNKPLTIKLTADSKLKRMPNFAGMATGAGAPGAAGRPPSGGMMPPAGGMARPGMGGPPDLSQMLERMPAGKIEELKPGDTIVVSSTQGASKDRITAILLLANADMLIRMASMSRQSGSAPSMNMGMSGMGVGAGAGGLGGLELPGMTP